MGEAQTAEGKGGLGHEAAPVEEPAAEGEERCSGVMAFGLVEVLGLLDWSHAEAQRGWGAWLWRVYEFRVGGLFFRGGCLRCG